MDFSEQAGRLRSQGGNQFHSPCNLVLGIPIFRVNSLVTMVSKEATPILSILLMLAAAGSGALGSFLYKTGAQRAGESARALPAEPRLWGGVLCYLLVMVFFIAAFRNGGALSVLYPVYASTFLVSAVISLVAFGTPILPVNVGGMVLLVAGMYLMGVS